MPKRVFKDRTISQTEANRRFQDSQASIDKELQEAIKKIDWARRNKAESNLVEWVKTYCVGMLLEEQPPENGEEVLRRMEYAVMNHGNYNILMGRGQGKSAYISSIALASLSLGLQSFVVIVSHDSAQAKSLLADLGRCVSEPDTPFAQDYPHIVLPFVLNPRTRRRQTINKKDTRISLNSSQLVFPTIDGYKSSGNMVVVRGITSGIRGIRRASINGQSSRPTMVILDDLQDSEIASSQESVQKLMNLVKAEVFGLGGKQRLSILQSMTPIKVDDYCQQCVEDKKSWQTSIFKSIISYPTNKELWKRYFTLWDEESVNGDLKHQKSLEFYRQNKDDMDCGSQVFNPNRYSTGDGHISAIQKLLEMQHCLGSDVFNAEYQMEVRKYDFALDISPNNVISKIGEYGELQIPENSIRVIASTDCNFSKYLTTTICAFERDGTAHCIYKEFHKCHIDAKLSEVEYNKQAYNIISRYGQKLSSLGIKIDAWTIDANGTPFNGITSYCKHPTNGIPTAGFIGKASHLYSPFMKSRLRDDIHHTLLCGDTEEHNHPNNGRKYTYWDSDYYREMTQKAILQEMGCSGGMDFFRQPKTDMTEWAIQITNEKLKFKKSRPDGRTEYFWKSLEPHDSLDSLAQCVATFYSLGVAVTDASPIQNKRHIPYIPKRKTKLRII